MLTGKKAQLMTLLIIGCLITLCVGSSIRITAQEDGSKGLKPEEAGVKTNPKRKKRTRPITLRTRDRFTPRPAPAGTEYAQVGITILRVDAGNSKGVDQVGTEQTQERLDTNAAYTTGDTIRLSIVSPTGGYLYIVDREQYTDGSYGPSVLAFPTTKTRGGNNLIQAWEPVQVPAYPSVWKFTPRTLKAGEARKIQRVEVLTVIISPKPLVDRSRITDKQLALNKGEFESWQAQGKATIQQFDLENSVGETVQTRTKSVVQEGTEAAPVEEELDAQTTYQVAIKPGAPIVVTVPLRFEAPATPNVKKK